MDLGVDGRIGGPVPKSVDQGTKQGQEAATIPLLLMGDPSALERTLRLKVCAPLFKTPSYDKRELQHRYHDDFFLC